MKSALIIIDVQKAMFLEEEKLYNEMKVLEHIKEILKVGRSKKMPIIYIQHTETDGPFKEGELSWAIHDDIKPDINDLVIQKTSLDSFYKTPLNSKLTEMGIDTLFIAGMQTEFCVDTTLRNAFSRGYINYVFKDGHTTFDNAVITGEQIVKHHSQIWNHRFCQLITLEDFIGMTL